MTAHNSSALLTPLGSLTVLW